MTELSRISLITLCIGVTALAATAADPAAAAASLSEISKISVDAKSGLAEAALSGDTEAIAEASKRSDAVDAAMAQAQESYMAMEKAIESGDEDAAQAAADAVMASLEKAADALSGVIPEEVMDAVKEWKDSKKNTGGGPGQPYDPPNMYDVPWNSAQVSSFAQSHSGNLWGSGSSPQDREATPE